MPSPDPIREIAEGCIAVRIRLLNRYVSGLCDAGLREHGLSIALTNILVAVGCAGPITPSQVAAKLVLDRSTLSRDVQTLLAQGLLRKVPGTDKRSHALELTPAGRDKLAALLPAWQKAQEELRDLLGADNLVGIFAAAGRIWQEMKS